MEFYLAGRSEGGSFDDGIEAALQRILADPEFVYRGERGAGRAGRRQELSHQRSGAGVAAVVLPVEQHSRRRADRSRRAGQAQGSGRAREAGAAHAGGSEVRSADRQLHRAVAERALAEDQRAGRESVPGFRRQPAERVPARDRTVLRQHRARGSQRPRSADGGLHVRQRAAGEALRHPEHLWPAVPPRDAAAGARHAPRPAGQGRAADGDVERRPAPRR